MMKGGNRGRRLLVWLRKYFDAGDVKVDENTRRDVIAGLNELIVEAQEAAPDSRYYDAIGMIIFGLEALAQKTLKANPFSKEADEAEEEKWRELADASRELRPLFDAWVRASEPNSESAKYKNGFHRRLVEAMATVAEIAAYERVYRLNQQKRGGKKRPNSTSPFTKFIVSRLKRNPRASAKEIKDLLFDDALDGKSGEFQLSNDKLTILWFRPSTSAQARVDALSAPSEDEAPEEREDEGGHEDRPKRLKFSGIPSAVAKAKKKLLKNKCR